MLFFFLVFLGRLMHAYVMIWKCSTIIQFGMRNMVMYCVLGKNV